MTEKEAIEIIKQTPLMRYIADRNPKGELGEALEMAVEALERMVPKKTRKGGVMGFDGEEAAFCPTCGLDNIAWGMGVCVDCGQRLDYGDE